MRTVNRFCSLAFALAIVLSGVHNVGAQTAWQVYTDPRFGFSVEYPLDWEIVPRDDQPGVIGGVLSFESRASTQEGVSSRKVVIGLHLTEIKEELSSKEWTENYLREITPNPSQLVITKSTELSLPSVVASSKKPFYVHGSTPRGEFQQVNIPHGRVVWFIWANNGNTDDTVYAHMLFSFRFAKGSPNSLVEAYGVEVENLHKSGVPESLLLTADPPGFRLPFSGTYIITQGPGCWSTHQGTDFEAIDYSMVANTRILATYNGNVAFMGWGGAYGNLLKIAHLVSGVNYVSWYAHLNSFAPLYTGQWVSWGQFVANSGSTGSGSTGPHLHFQVNNSSGQSVWIRTLLTTTWYSGDPNNPCSSGDDGYATGS